MSDSSTSLHSSYYHKQSVYAIVEIMVRNLAPYHVRYGKMDESDLV